MSKYTFPTLYGVGLVPKAPGTAGSAVAALLAYFILMLPYGWLVLAAGVGAVTYLGTKSSTRYMHTHHTAHDPSEIVIDELAGLWLTYTIWHLWLIVLTGNNQAALDLLDEVASSPLFLAIGFVLFRFFDIVKPWPIGWVDRKMKSGFGIMLDDLLAAIPAGIILYLIYLFSPVFLGEIDSTL